MNLAGSQRIFCYWAKILATKIKSSTYYWAEKIGNMRNVDSKIPVPWSKITFSPRPPPPSCSVFFLLKLNSLIFLGSVMCWLWSIRSATCKCWTSLQIYLSGLLLTFPLDKNHSDMICVENFARKSLKRNEKFKEVGHMRNDGIHTL